MNGNGDQRSIGQVTHLGLRGHLNTARVGVIELKLTSHRVPSAKPLFLDMSEVTFIASLGLRMLLTVAKMLDRRGAKTVLLNLPPLVREVLKASRIDQLISVIEDQNAARVFLTDGKNP